MIEEVRERAEKRAMNPVEYLRWRNLLRQDYQQAFDPPAYRPATHLPFGHANARLLAPLVEVSDEAA